MVAGVRDRCRVCELVRGELLVCWVAMEGEAVVVAVGAKAGSVWVFAGTLLLAALVGYAILRVARSRKNLPPVVDTAVPFVGGLLKFIKGPVVLLREQYGRLGSVFTVKILTRNITFLVGPEVSAHFFKAQESDLSQREVANKCRDHVPSVDGFLLHVFLDDSNWPHVIEWRFSISH